MDAINSFRREHGLLHIAVCSRIADYQALGMKLRLRSAVEVQPLTKPQVQDYLDRVGEPLHGLRTAVQDDPVFWELLETPLMLWVAMLAYRNVPRVFAIGESLELRRHHLFAHFVEAMFLRRSGVQRYTPDQTMRWLSYLARTLTRKNQPLLYLENLDFDWMPTRVQQWLARAEIFLVCVAWAGLSIGIVSSLRYGLSVGLSGLLSGGLGILLRIMLAEGLTFGLCLGLIGNVFKIRPVEKAGFRIDPSFRLAAALRDGLSGGLAVGLILGLIAGLTLGLVAVKIVGMPDGLLGRLWIGMLGGLAIGAAGGMIYGLTKMFTSEAISETRATPNQGTRRSVKMAMIFGLIVGLCFGLGFMLVNGLSFGLTFGLIAAMFSGGLFALKHVTLRLGLWQSRSAPLHYLAFLNEAKQLLFLRQVGGGYIFMHRLLREYFASLR